MQAMIELYYRFHEWLFGKLKHLSGLPILMIRLYLGPIMIIAGLNKFANMEDIISWFGNPDWHSAYLLQHLWLTLPLLLR